MLKGNIHEIFHWKEQKYQKIVYCMVLRASRYVPFSIKHQMSGDHSSLCIEINISLLLQIDSLACLNHHVISKNIWILLSDVCCCHGHVKNQCLRPRGVAKSSMGKVRVMTKPSLLVQVWMWTVCSENVHSSFLSWVLMALRHSDCSALRSS